MNKKRLTIFIGLLILVLAAIIIGLSLNISSKTKKGVDHIVGLEKGSNPEGQVTAIGLENGTDLYNHLLPSQYVEVRQAIGTYITSNIGKNVVSATLVSNSVVQQANGSISFSIRTSAPVTTFDVTLKFPTAEEIIFSVPTSSYSVDLYPYGSATNSATSGSYSSSP